MTTVENKPFKLSAIVYPKVYEILKSKASVEHPLNVDEILVMIPEAKSTIQVYDAIRSNKQNICSMREGKRKVFWWKGDSVCRVQTQGHQPEPKLKSFSEVSEALGYAVAPAEAQPADRPDIHVGKDKVVISTSKFKITIEL